MRNSRRIFLKSAHIRIVLQLYLCFCKCIRISAVRKCYRRNSPPVCEVITRISCAGGIAKPATGRTENCNNSDDEAPLPGYINRERRSLIGLPSIVSWTLCGRRRFGVINWLSAIVGPPIRYRFPHVPLR